MSSREALLSVLLVVSVAIGSIGVVAMDGSTAPGVDAPDTPAVGVSDLPGIGASDATETDATDDAEADPADATPTETPASEPEAIVGETVDRAGEHGDVHATFVVEYVVDGERHERRSEMWDRDGTAHHRYAILESTDDRQSAGRVVSSDGETAYSYDPDDDELVRYDLDEGNVTFPQAEYAHYGEMLETFEIEYVGRERVAGREAHHLRFTLPTESPDGVNVVVGETEYVFPIGSPDDDYVFESHSLYVDAERAYPLGERAVLSGPDGARTTFARTVESIRFDADHDADRFRVDPPDDTEVTEYEFGDDETFESAETANETVPFDLPSPPSSAAFTPGETVVSERDGSVSVRVEHAGDADVAVSVSNESVDPPGITRRVGDREATVSRTMSGLAIHWECDRLSYTVYGTAGEDRLFDVAESIESAACPR